MTGIILTWSYRVSLAIRDIIQSGRGIRRLVTLCGTIQQLVKESDRRLAGEVDSDDEDASDENPGVPRLPQDLEELTRQ